MGINDSNASFGPCCAFSNNCCIQNYFQYLCNLSWDNTRNTRGLEEKSSCGLFLSKYPLTIKCPSTGSSCQKRSSTVLSRVQCSTRTPTRGSPQTEGRALAATQPHRTRASPRGTAAASSNGCGSHLTTCPLQDVGQHLGLSVINRLLSPDV